MNVVKKHSQDHFEKLQQIKCDLWSNKRDPGDEFIFFTTQKKIEKLLETPLKEQELMEHFLDSPNKTSCLIPYDARQSTFEIWWLSSDEFTWNKKKMIWTFMDQETQIRYVIYR